MYSATSSVEWSDVRDAKSVETIPPQRSVLGILRNQVEANRKSLQLSYWTPARGQEDIVRGVEYRRALVESTNIDRRDEKPPCQESSLAERRNLSGCFDESDCFICEENSMSQQKRRKAATTCLIGRLRKCCGKCCSIGIGTSE